MDDKKHCEHTELKQCEICLVVYCEKCGAEWVRKLAYGSGNVVYGGTMKKENHTHKEKKG